MSWLNKYIDFTVPKTIVLKPSSYQNHLGCFSKYKFLGIIPRNSYSGG